MGEPTSARDRILARVQAATERRDRTDHPGAFAGRTESAESTGESAESTFVPPGGDSVETFEARFTHSGGEVVRVTTRSDAGGWLADFCGAFSSVTIGRGIENALAPDLPRARPDEAEIAVSAGRGAVAETGSLLLDARDGRRTQLLAPTHVVVVSAARVHASLRDALLDLRADLPSAVGLHSGPSKSADIGQVMVKGVHGPGRLIALLVEDGAHA